LKIVAVEHRRSGTDSTIRSFARQYGLTFDILHDPQGKITELYDINRLPGDVHRRQGWRDQEEADERDQLNAPEARSLVDRLLAEQAD